MSETVEDDVESAAEEVPEHVLIQRGQALSELQAAMGSVRESEFDRKRMTAVEVLVPSLGVVFCAACVLFMAARDYNRPVPRDHFEIALMHDSSGLIEPLISRDDLPASRRAILLDNSAIRFIQAWEGYVWRANQANYNYVSAVTAGEPLRKQYQERFTPNAPGNVDALYGPQVTRDVVAVDIVHIPNAPYVLDARMKIRLTKPTETTCQIWTTRLSFKEDTDHILPLAFQKLYDPMDIIFVSYNSHVDPTAPGLIPC